MNELERKVLAELAKPKDNKERHTFTISKSVKMALAAWCKEKGKKESPTVEAMIKQMVPARFFKT